MIRSFLSLNLVGRAVAVVGVSIGIVGCGDADGRLPIGGNVSWEGRPLEKGSIVFVPTSGHRGPKVGAQIIAGQYQIDRERGPTEGMYRVEVRSDTGEHPHSPTDARPRAAPAKSQITISPEFNSESRLTVAISADQTQFNFELPTKAP
jgi:hypothetical protein